MFRMSLVVVVAAAGALQAQPLDSSSLIGPYGFVQLLVDVDGSGAAQNARNMGGTMTFDGAGGYTLQGVTGSGSGELAGLTRSGTYQVSANGFVTLTNPLEPSLTLNARLGVGAEIVLGSTTGVGDRHDMFVAARAPDSADDSLLNGRYTAASFLLPNGSDQAAKTALINLEPNGQGGFAVLSLDGHAADQNDTPLSETVTGATYQLNTDGSGVLILGSGSTLFSGEKRLFISAGGDYLLGFSADAGGRDIFVGVKNASGVTDASLNGNFWMVDLFADLNVAIGRSYTSAVGAMRSQGAGTVWIAQRQDFFLPPNPFSPLDFSGINSYGLGSDGTGFLQGGAEPGVTNFAVGAPGAAAALTAEGAAQTAAPNAFVGSQVFQTLSSYDIHGLTFGVRVPSFSEADPFVAPNGVLNGASFAPLTFPAAPGTLMTAFGSGLAPAAQGTSDVPWPTQLAGVGIDFGGVPAPLFFVVGSQINFQTPFAAAGPTATVSVNNNGAVSNTVEIPVAATSPGIFSLLQNGIGPGAILDVNFNIVSEQNSVAPGDFVQIFMTGLGAVNPQIGDGEAAPSQEPFARVVDSELQVLFGGEAGNIIFAGAAPGFIGLYQVNVQIPTTSFTGPAVPVQVSTSNAFSDFVDIAIGL